MADTINHVTLSVKNKTTNNKDIMYPKNTSDDVVLNFNNANVPATVVSGTNTLSDITNKLGSAAFKNTEDISISMTAKIIITVDTGSTITCTKTGGGSVPVKQTSSTTWECDVEYGEYTIHGSVGSDSTSEVIEVDTIKLYKVSLIYPKIYGAEWDGTSTTVWSRTDHAAGFSNPVPYVSGATSYSSPFDNLYPWSGMVKEERTGGIMVKIPKFWFKWTKNGSKLKLQIADKYVDGFSVSPAHIDRGDGKGERDAMYVGRYHCDYSTYKSVSGGLPRASITRSTARTSIHALGINIWQMDYATRVTIWMLYLVEFADWNSQKTIGCGCGNSSSSGSMGYTNNMPYHTGTTLSSRTAYGISTQYRYIEGLWDNVFDYIDGCYYNTNGINIILNPNNFSDTDGGTLIGVPSSGYPSAMSVSTVSGYEWVIYPTTSNGSSNTYVPDYWGSDKSNSCLYSGGDYYAINDRGLFYVAPTGAKTSDSSHVGCRLIELP